MKLVSSINGPNREVVVTRNADVMSCESSDGGCLARRIYELDLERVEMSVHHSAEISHVEPFLGDGAEQNNRIQLTNPLCHR